MSPSLADRLLLAGVSLGLVFGPEDGGSMLLRSVHGLNSMELSSTREATSCEATRKFPSILWDPKVQYRIDKSSPPVLILSQTNPVHTTHLRLGLLSGLFPSGFSTSNLYALQHITRRYTVYETSSLYLVTAVRT
jgi:hypothetical protein